MGNCFGDPTWQASQCEFVVQVKGTCMAVSGPRVLGVALEERTTPEELGGWKVHAEVTGQVDAFAEDDEHCARLMREFVSYMPSNCEEEPPLVPTKDPPDRSVDSLNSIIPDDTTRPYDMEEVIGAIVDDGKYFILKPYFARPLVVCLARMNGQSVGIIANQPLHNDGALGPDECDKAVDLVVMCDSFNIPLLFLVDTPGYLGGKAAEEKEVSRQINAFTPGTFTHLCPQDIGHHPPGLWLGGNQHVRDKCRRRFQHRPYHRRYQAGVAGDGAAHIV